MDPQRLEEVDQRLGLIHQLARKHHVQPSELAAHCQTLSDELSDLSEADVQIDLMEEELGKLLTSYQDRAEKSVLPGTKAPKTGQGNQQAAEKTGYGVCQFQCRP